MEKLAIHGGEPVRKTDFPTNYLGVTMYGPEELAEITDVITTKSPFRHYGIGNPRKVETFEANVREYFGSRFAIALSSGTGALFCVMAALGIGPGDEVIIPGFSWYSNFFCITNVGALPVFADVDETLALDPVDFEKKITDRTKAVIIISYQGCPPDMDAIMKIAAARNIIVIEDIAQAFGATYKKKKLGTIGDITIASFQQNKTLCCGEGGLILTENEDYFAKAVRYHDLGMMRPLFANQIEDKGLVSDEASFAGNQYRMNELSGAVMVAQLKKLDSLLEKCRGYHKQIRDSFTNNPHFTIRWVDGDCGVAVFILFKTVNEAQQFEKALTAEGIPLGPKSACRNLMTQYPIKTKRLSHDALPPFGKGFAGEHTNYEKLNENNKTDGIVARFIAISIGPEYSEADISDIIAAIQKVSDNLY